jgi:phosphohistidine swiveling domain-containing protein
VANKNQAGIAYEGKKHDCSSYGSAIPVEPLQGDEEAYSGRIADAVCKLLADSTTQEEKERISCAVRHMTWASICRKTFDVYCEAVLNRLARICGKVDEIYAVSLHSTATNIKPLCGAKAGGLHFLINMDRPVPPGFVLTSAAFNDFVMKNKKIRTRIDKYQQLVAKTAIKNGYKPCKRVMKELQDLIFTAPMPESIANAIRNGVAGDFPVAVRSSASDEDSAVSSHSGEYETILNLKNYEDTAMAIRTVWWSIFSKRLLLYRSGMECKGMFCEDNAAFLRQENGIAVIIQKYIPARASGVAHSVNAENGLPEIVIECAQAAKAVTDSHVTPDQWRFACDNGIPVLLTKTIQRTPSLCDAQAHGIAETIADLAGEYHTQTGIRTIDVEFCAANDGSLYFLQIRPLNNVAALNINPVCVGVARENVSQEAEKILIDGITANPGAANGRLVVIDLPYRGTETDYFSIARSVVKKGDIVCTQTVNLSWTVLFDEIAGLIVERGGVTSHSANIARERGIPCLVGAEGACKALQMLHKKPITMDAFNRVVYAGTMPISEKPLNELVWRAICGDREYDRKEPSHWVDTDGKEWVRKPTEPLNPLQFQLYLDAWHEANARYPQHQVPIKIKGNVIYIGFDELIALGDAMAASKTEDPFALFEDRKDTVRKMGELIESIEVDYASLQAFFKLYSHMIMHFHLRAEFRRRVALALRDKAMPHIPESLVNVVTYLINKNAPIEITKTRKFDADYRSLLSALSEREKQIMTALESESADYIREKAPALWKKLNAFLASYKLTRQQLDDWNAPLPMTALVEKMQKDLADGFGAQSHKAKVLRTMDGFEAFLKLLQPFVLAADPTFDFDHFVKVLVLSEAQAIQVENERPLQHRWQQVFRAMLLEYADKLASAGLLFSAEEILEKNKDEILRLAYAFENNCAPSESLSEKAVKWSESIDSIELHLTNRCNLGEAECCKGICT